MEVLSMMSLLSRGNGAKVEDTILLDNDMDDEESDREFIPICLLNHHHTHIPTQPPTPSLNTIEIPPNRRLYHNHRHRRHNRY